MASTKASLSHLERTAAEPRDDGLHMVKITHIRPINETIRLFELQPLTDHIKFRPGQWLDVYCPGIPEAGGFTITSSAFYPQAPSPSNHRIELAIQKSPESPPVAYLWQPIPKIIDSELQIKVGGSFTWPPVSARVKSLKRVVFVAGGVGINPLMSMVRFLADKYRHERKTLGDIARVGFEVRFLYSTKELEKAVEILFLERLAEIFEMFGTEGKLELFLTGSKETSQEGDGSIEVAGHKVSARRRRITDNDLFEALGPVETRASTVCYICGVPGMTDDFVEKARKVEGMLEENVLFEKWW
ncbi:uncharacterized protein PAC_18379 [Phialocephala subalpina]|uniref:FAD-binding FR-type domain-containing protein n=1 Tax=Phialocephala subalpina TaxID=576137 RepID=A0A1L7XTX9_9HELO|nr:uncharacterized protein PAC_18379 [Phialocephala subalpina]